MHLVWRTRISVQFVVARSLTKLARVSLCFVPTQDSKVLFTGAAVLRPIERDRRLVPLVLLQAQEVLGRPEVRGVLHRHRGEVSGDVWLQV